MNQSSNKPNFETQLTAALERKPQVDIPTHFASRVAASMPAQRPARAKKSPHYGRVAANLSMVLLGCALVALPLLRPESILSMHSYAFALEMIFTAELLALGLWPKLWQTL